MSFGVANIFLLAAFVAIGVLTLRTLMSWRNARTTDQRTRERYALLAKLAEQPRESAELVMALLREEDAREDQRRLERRRARRTDGMSGGGVLIAVGLGLGLFLFFVAPRESVWLLGLMLVLMGVVLFGFAFFRRASESSADE